MHETKTYTHVHTPKHTGSLKSYWKMHFVYKS